MASIQTTLFFILSITITSVTAGCNEYCADREDDGTCCERFFLNVNRESDIVITASSSWDSNHGPHRAALYENEEGGIAAWAAGANTPGQWIQVDFGSPRKVTGVLLQGRGVGCCDQWVTSFRVLFSRDGEKFFSTPTIEGTFDRHTVARRYLDRPIVARYFRLVPITYSGHISIRFDLIGCNVPFHG